MGTKTASSVAGRLSNIDSWSYLLSGEPLQVVNLKLSDPTLSTVYTVKPFNLAAQKVGDLAFKIILAPFILAN